jgi:ABC-type Fe2+-enterobactin transport system substrate-binding protein
MSRSSAGKVTLSHAPNRMITHDDGTITIGINRKPDWYVSIVITPDGQVAAASAPTRKEAAANVHSQLGSSTAYMQYLMGNAGP